MITSRDVIRRLEAAGWAAKESERVPSPLRQLMRYVATLEREGRATDIDFPDCPGCQTLPRARNRSRQLRGTRSRWLELHLEDGDGYGTVRTYAQILGESRHAELLQQMLDEEGKANDLLTEIAESSVNAEALAGE